MSELDAIIPPEIKDDEFYRLITVLAREEQIETVLEIGSSAGGGSTEAFVSGLEQNPRHPVLFCMEVSQPRFAELARRYADKPFVHCYNTSSIGLDKFPDAATVANFYHGQRSGLNAFPLERVLGWLEQDITYVRDSGHNEEGIARIKRENGIRQFDCVLIDGSEFAGEAELEEVYGAKLILLDDVATYKNNRNYHRLKQDAQYSLVAENWRLRNGYAVFRRAGRQYPIHFFTIVLNGEPFIRHHIEEFSRLDIPWHWHIVEGVADLQHDTGWSLARGGHIAGAIHRNGLSVDGTTAYLDELAHEHPDNVSLYRKHDGAFWDGKLEMVNAPLSTITDECLLWQVDADELWRAEQIEKVVQLFMSHPERTSAFFHCHFFITPDLVTVTPGAYSHHDAWEWLRTWRFTPGMRWFSHEPPALGRQSDNQWIDVGKECPFTHVETEEKGAVFTHYAYVLESQLRFKETYYGYMGALDCWKRLCAATDLPVRLREYLPWVGDDAMADRVERRYFGKNVEPIHRVEQKIRVVVDGVFFQLNNSGIARVWRSLLHQWSRDGRGRNIVVLDRVGTAPKYEGIAYRNAVRFTPDALDFDCDAVEDACREERADVFISTYYTTPTGTPSVFLAYDMIPEVTGMDLHHWEWMMKHRAIRHAAATIAISQNTAADVQRFFPEVLDRPMTVAPCGVGPEFTRSTQNEIEQFKSRMGITRPYFLFIGARHNYKNARLAFEGLARMKNASDRLLVCLGGGPVLDPDLASLVQPENVRLLGVEDRELRHAYSGAVALVFPSKYEGFGLPILEAQACGTPVITCRNGSIPEVAGNAVMYVDDNDPSLMAYAMEQMEHSEVRSALVEAGFRNVQRFSWKSMADAVWSALVAAARRPVVRQELVNAL